MNITQLRATIGVLIEPAHPISTTRRSHDRKFRIARLGMAQAMDVAAALGAAGLDADVTCRKRLTFSYDVVYEGVVTVIVPD